MSNGATHNYDFKQKNDWRGWVWNQITANLAIPARDAVVLYLAGRDDLDRQKAKARGFRDENLIAVDCDPDSVKDLRLQGRLAAHGDLFEILFSWPRHKRIHVLHADMCCGFSTDLVDKFAAVRFRGIEVVSINLMRGRDKAVRNYASLSAMDPVRVKSGKLHRGALTYFAIQERVSRYAVATGETQYGQYGEHFTSLCRECNGQFFEYKSGGFVFDSVVYRNLFDRSRVSNATFADVANHLRNHFSTRGADRRRAIATAATHTRLALK